MMVFTNTVGTDGRGIAYREPLRSHCGRDCNEV